MALVVLTAHLGLARPAAGQTVPAGDSAPRATPAQSLDAIALELANPFGGQFSIANEMAYQSNQGYFGGASDRPERDFLIQPSFPFRLKNGRTLVVRGTIPVSAGEPSVPFQFRDFADWKIRQFADLLPDDSTVRRDHGFMDDIGVDVAYGGVKEKGRITLFGAAVVLPSSTDGTTSRHQILLGPEVTLGKVTSWGTIGASATHVVNVTTNDKQPPYETSMTSLKVFFAYGLGSGWQLISNPVVEYDWEALEDNKLLLPIGGGFAKTTRIRSMPMRISLEIYRYIESPAAFGPDWLVRFGVTPVLKSSKRAR